MGKIFQLDIWKFIKLNFLSKNIKRDKGTYIVPYRNSVVDIDKNANVVLHAKLVLNLPEIKGSKKQTTLFIRGNGKLIVNGTVILRSGTTLQVQKEGSITIGKADINHDATIIAKNHMKIGDGLLVSRNVVILDSDFNKIMNEQGAIINTPRDIMIGDHVWIGVNATILRGAQIGAGAIVSAGAVVGGKIKEGTMAAGNPARSYSAVLWEK